MGVCQLVQVLFECKSLNNVFGANAREDFMSFGTMTHASACGKLKSVRFNLNFLLHSLAFDFGTYSGAIGVICTLSSHYLQEKKNADGIGMALHAKSTWKLNGCVAS